MSGSISEVSYDGALSSDFIEIAVPTGTDTSSFALAVYDDNGDLVTTYSLGAIQSTNGGLDVYVIDSGTGGFLGITDKSLAALVDDTSTVLQFSSFAGKQVTAKDGPAIGLKSTDIGTMIDTPGGLRAVETLRPDDLVLTADHGAQPIRWVRSGDHPLEQVDDDAKPVLIQVGALGSCLPAADLIVSPQRRILVGGQRQLQQYFATESFTPAKSLTSWPGIRHMRGKRKITWIHFACDHHEVVFANGCQSESLLLGPMVVQALTRRARNALIAIFPQTPGQASLNGQAARPCLNVGDVRRTLQRVKGLDGKPGGAQEIQRQLVEYCQ